jgi:hypothetical protein
MSASSSNSRDATERSSGRAHPKRSSSGSAARCTARPAPGRSAWRAAATATGSARRQSPADPPPRPDQKAGNWVGTEEAGRLLASPYAGSLRGNSIARPLPLSSAAPCGEARSWRSGWRTSRSERGGAGRPARRAHADSSSPGNAEPKARTVTPGTSTGATVSSLSQRWRPPAGRLRRRAAAGHRDCPASESPADDRPRFLNQKCRRAPPLPQPTGRKQRGSHEHWRSRPVCLRRR